MCPWCFCWSFRNHEGPVNAQCVQCGKKFVVEIVDGKLEGRKPEGEHGGSDRDTD